MNEITVSAVQSKWCRQCDTVRNANQFHVESRSKDGLRAQCKPCRNRVERARRANNVESERARRRELYQIKFAHREGIAIEAATHGNRREIRRARRIGRETQNQLPRDLIQDLQGGISVRPLHRLEDDDGLDPSTANLAIGDLVCPMRDALQVLAEKLAGRWMLWFGCERWPSARGTQSISLSYTDDTGRAYTLQVGSVSYPMNP